MNMYLSVYSTICVIGLNIIYARDPTINITQGSLKGKCITTRRGRTIFGFLGIPYAAPPVGELRFQKPFPAKSWDGIRDAVNYSSVCLQNKYFIDGLADEFIGEEDCLYLNVFTPNISQDAYIPVMVWIHGGGYFAGSAQMFMGPEYLLDKDVILVTMNYRLGVLGFLTNGDEILPGNYGIKDQTAALRWVRDNIKYFGGNKDYVTLFGESAGASCVSLHMMSPLSKGLFHAAISQSGTAHSPFAVGLSKTNKNITETIAELLKCSLSNSALLLECFRKIPVDVFFKTVNNFMKAEGSWLIFRPNVEPPTSEEPFLTTFPSQTVTSIPWMLGLNSEDGSVIISLLTRDGIDQSLQYVNKNFNSLMPLSLLIKDRTKNVTQTIQRLRQFYFGDKEINRETLKDLVNMFTDDYFLYGTTKSLQKHKGLAYYYYFNYKGANTLSSVIGNKDADFGVGHIDDLLYLSPLDDLIVMRNMSQADEVMIDRMVTLWTNFAIYRNPTPGMSFAAWKPVMGSGQEYLHINNNGFIMSKNLLKERRDFWLSFPITDH